MISCTEFIPSYSELFSFLDKNYGRREVDRFWEYLFAPTGDGIPLINHIKKEGIRGCFTYWSASLSEEAADFTLYLNEKDGWFLLKMHHCPSKGRLLELKEAIGITPYYDYCLHCDSYRYAVEKIGLQYIFNTVGTENAACSILIADPNIFNGRMIVDENTEIMDRNASDNEYFHKDFHSSMNMGIEYLGSNYGIDTVHEYLSSYTKNVYRRFIEQSKAAPLSALKNMIYDTYRKEKSEDAIKLTLTNCSLKVEVYYCPAVKHLHETGRVVSSWYRYTTEFIMKTLADCLDIEFNMQKYDEATGAAEYSFYLK